MYKKKLMKICLASALAVSMVSTNVAPVLAAEINASDSGVSTSISATINFVAEGYDKPFKTINNVTVSGNVFNPKEIVDFIPDGYQLASNEDVMLEEGQVTIVLKSAPMVKIQFYDTVSNKEIGGGDYFVNKDGDEIFNFAELPIPDGYKLVETGDQFVKDYADGNVHTVKVEPIQKSSIVKVVFDYNGKEVGGGDFFVDEDGDGVFNLSELTLPEGYKLVEAGDQFVKDYADGNVHTVKVEPIQKSSIVKVVFDYNGEEVGGGDFFVDEDGDGVFNLSELTLPEGYKLVEAGDQFVKDYADGNVHTVKVEPIQKSSIVKVVFDYNGEEVGGGDFFVDEDGDGVFNLSELTLPEGYKLVEAGDQFVKDYADGNAHTVKVEPIQKSSIVKVVFDYNGEEVGGGDFFVDEDGDGVFNLSELTLPEGYELVETGDQFVKDYADGNAHTVKVTPIQKASIIKILFEHDGHNVGGGDFFVDEDGDGVFNLSELILPDGYKLKVTGDQFVKDYADGNAHVIEVEPVDPLVSVGDFFVNVKFVCDGKELAPAADCVVNGTQTDNGQCIYTMFNYSELEEYVPEGYVMTVSGDVTVYDGETLEVNVAPKDASVSVGDFFVNVKFVSGGTEVVPAKDYIVNGTQVDNGEYVYTMFNYSELKEYVPEGYAMTAAGDVTVYDGETLEVNLDKIQKESIINVRFVYHKKVLAGGDYFVDEDGDGIFNWSELSEYVPDGYKMLRWGDESVDAGPFVVQLAKKTNSVPGEPGIDGKKNGWYKVGDSDWSYYINNRKVVSDWVAVEEADPYNNNEVGTVWYHMNSEGLMDRGWIIDESGWKVYLLDSNGRMMHSQWVNAPASEKLNRPAGLYKLTDDGAVQMNGWAESVTPGIYWFCNAGTGLFEVDNPASWGSEKLF